jgi:hypothetical protein
MIYKTNGDPVYICIADGDPVYICIADGDPVYICIVDGDPVYKSLKCVVCTKLDIYIFVSWPKIFILHVFFFINQ